MAVDRRAILGLGLLGVGAGVTTAVTLLRDKPPVQRVLGEKTAVRGFAGGAMADFLAEAAKDEALGHAALALAGEDAGSVEQARDPALLGQKPDFLWPSAAPLADLAARYAPPLRRQALLSSPLVFHSWAPIAEALVQAGIAAPAGAHFVVNLSRLLDAATAGKPWSASGGGLLSRPARIACADPNTAGSGYLFAGLAAVTLAGPDRTAAALDEATPHVAGLIAGIGFKWRSSARAFDDYIVGGPDVSPMVVGYESQRLAWERADPERARRAQGAMRPVMLYPDAGVLAVHTLVALTSLGTRLFDLFAAPSLRDLAWRRHGLRDASGVAAGAPQLPSQAALPEPAQTLKILEALQRD